MIKLRAWDKEKKEWIKGNQVQIFQTALGFPKALVLEQYADLTDKDGKPLDWWQGDIITFDEETGPSEIVLKDGCFWAIRIGKSLYPDPPLWRVAKLATNIVVRGNKHANPELLEGAKRCKK